MKEQVFNTENVWLVHSPRSKNSWYVKCPSRSGAKIFLTGPLGPGVPTSEGPFETSLVPPPEVPEEGVLQAVFYSAHDPRNFA